MKNKYLSEGDQAEKQQGGIIGKILTALNGQIGQHPVAAAVTPKEFKRACGDLRSQGCREKLMKSGVFVRLREVGGDNLIIFARSERRIDVETCRIVNWREKPLTPATPIMSHSTIQPATLKVATA